MKGNSELKCCMVCVPVMQIIRSRLKGVWWAWPTHQILSAVGVDFAGPFSEGLAAVRVRGRWGYINRSGLFVIPLQFESALPFSEGLAPIILNDGRGGYVDAQGLVRLLCGSCRPWRFIRNLAAVTFGDHVDYIDKSGKKVELQTELAFAGR